MSASDKTISSLASVSIGAKITPARLTEIKVIKCRDIDYDIARKEVAGYFKRLGEAFPDEAAEDLVKKLKYAAKKLSEPND
jgi:hypothetical protein